ncbi:hypothetical protein ABZW11_17160 [Nonomuraea sp. NPDC004580]|uniref:hypothetical protein n=1 Tax=Nonomuraea sp. NPDC004580 TaxID=3154552 RepID=UPI0033AB6C46
MEPWYASRETVKAALDAKETARSNAQVDRALEAASREIEGCLHRVFYPVLATRSFDWPSPNRSRSWRLWLDGNEVAELVELVAGGVTIPSGHLLLYPSSGPPYSRIEVSLDTSSTFSSGDSHQQAIELTAVYAGCALREADAGVLAGAVATVGATTVDVSDGAAVGVGDLIRVGDERMVVVGRQMLDTGQDLAADLAASAGAVSVAVADGSGFSVDEVILVGAERMLVVDVAGNTLVVKRAWDGSVLASHSSGADIYAPRRLVVERGAAGTTAATHLSGAAVARHVPPGPVSALCVGLALAQVLGEQSGYARPEGRSGGSSTVSEGRRRTQEFGVGLAALWDAVYASCGRKGRVRAV